MPNPVTFSKLDVINMALVAQGQDELQSIGEISGTSKSARIMRIHYDLVAQACHTKTSWRFATAKAALNKLSGAPTNRWAAAWNLPPDHLKTLTTWPPSNYEQANRQILTNEQTRLEIDYIRLVGEGFWPAWFTRYVVACLVIATKKGITGEEVDESDRFQMEKWEGEALTADSQQQPNQTIQSNEFVDCRY